MQSTEKNCSGCGETKPLTDFYRNKNTSTGRGFYCKPCQSERTRAHRILTADAISARRKLDYRANQAERRAEARERYRARPGSWRVASWRSKGLDISWSEYEAIYAQQGGRCALCERHESEMSKALAVDHDHSTMRVRGLLCDDCNIALGRFRDSPDVLRRAIQYLGAH